MEDRIVHVAKRIFQRQHQEKKKSIIKVKSLSKKVAKDLAAQSITATPELTAKATTTTRDIIMETIKESKQFQLCQKKKTILSIVETTKTNSTKKRKFIDDDDDDADDTNNKDKNNDHKVSQQQWRQKHKIIMLDPTNNNTNNNNNNQKNNQDADKIMSYEPYYTFHDATKAIATPLIEHCTNVKHYQTPSPIQAQCWPILLPSADLQHQNTSSTSAKTKNTNIPIGQRDLIGIAETGSGKTLAFALPALSLLAATNGSTNKNNGKTKRLPRMLVLAPTRELAMQSHEVIADFGNCVGITSLVVYGGVSKQTQAIPLRQGQVDCIVATPGRIKDLIQDGTCNLGNITYLVLDEADRMLDMGFQEDVEFIIRQCPATTSSSTISTSTGTTNNNLLPRRQTCMFSATWPAAIQQLAAQYMVNPVRVYVGFEPGESTTTTANSNNNHNGDVSLVEDSLSANKRVKQIVEVIDDRAREGRLKQLLQEYTTTTRSSSTTNKKKSKGTMDNSEKLLEHDRILVFALYKKEADRLERVVRQWGYEVGSIHGNKSQEARSKSLNSFKDGSCPLLIATDVASRGLDIPNVEVVLNYTFPLTIEDYIHRIGRTGRAGKNGLSHTFFQPSDKSHAGELQQVMLQAGQIVPEELMKFGSTIKKKEHKLYGAHYNKGGSTMPMKQPTRIKFDD
jgi:ATP-dependent RNA helicase DBP3